MQKPKYKSSTRNRMHTAWSCRWSCRT